MCVRVCTHTCVFRGANTVAIDSRMHRPMGCGDVRLYKPVLHYHLLSSIEPHPVKCAVWTIDIDIGHSATVLSVISNRKRLGL